VEAEMGWGGGALLFFVGDMLFYGHWGAGAGFHEGMIETVRNASPGRLFAGGLVGPFAACLCIVGFWHVYLNVRPSQEFVGRVMLALFAVLMVCGSAIHTLWTARGLAMKFCYGSDDVHGKLLQGWRQFDRTYSTATNIFLSRQPYLHFEGV